MSFTQIRQDEEIRELLGVRPGETISEAAARCVAEPDEEYPHRPGVSTLEGYSARWQRKHARDKAARVLLDTTLDPWSRIAEALRIFKEAPR